MVHFFPLTLKSLPPDRCSGLARVMYEHSRQLSHVDSKEAKTDCPLASAIFAPFHFSQAGGTAFIPIGLTMGISCYWAYFR